MTKAKVYLAGPEVFLPTAIEIGTRKKALCTKYGFDPLYPFDNDTNLPLDPHQRALAIYRGNVDLMHRSDLIVANLTPFRGPSADVGTAFEVAYMASRRRPVFGYSNDARDLLDRTREYDSQSIPGETPDTWRDSLGMTIENFGLSDNLMIACCLELAGHPLVRRSVPASDRFSDLNGFEECLRQAAVFLA